MRRDSEEGVTFSRHFKLAMIRHFVALLVCLALPSSLLAQARLNDGKYELTDIIFGLGTALRSGQEATLAQITTGPTVTELESRKVVIEWTTNKKTGSSVAYGATTDYDLENGSAVLTTSHKVTLSGLDPETTYHYKAIAVESSGSTNTESADKTFTTTADTGITTIRVSDISYDKALITWKTGNFSLSKVEYGTTGAYGSTKATSSGTLSADHTVQLTDLSPGTEYHFRIVATNEKGTTQRSSDQTFATIALPKFISVKATPLSPNEVELRWATNTATSGIVKYRATSGPTTDQQTAGSPKPATSHTLVLKNLIGSTDYTFTIVATDEQGKQIESERQSFRTPVDTTPPKITNLKVSVTRSGDELILRASWTTNEPARGEIVYGPKTRLEETIDLPGPASLVTEHTLVAAGLKPSTPYGLTAFTTDPAGNRSEAEISFVSPRFSRNIFQLIADSFFSKFGWLTSLFR